MSRETGVDCEQVYRSRCHAPRGLKVAALPVTMTIAGGRIVMADQHRTAEAAKELLLY